MTDDRLLTDTIKFPHPESDTQARRVHHVTSRHYFVLENGKMRSIDRDSIEKAWQGKQPWPCNDGEVRILSAAFDETENVVGCYFLLISVVGDKVDAESIEEANHATVCQALETTHRTGRLLPGYERQTMGWPRDWRNQVAQELNVDVECIHDAGVGGPLLTAYTARVSIAKAAGMCALSQRIKLGLLTEKSCRANSEHCGTIEFSVPVELKPWESDPSHYLLEVTGTVKALSENDDSDELEVAGEMKLLIIKLAEARKHGVPVSFICDCYSNDLDELYCTLFADQEFKEEFDLAAPSGDLVYIESISLKSEYKGSPLFVQAVETAIATFASQGLTVACQSDFNDQRKLWQKLGFRELPRSELLVRSVKPRRI